MVILVKAKKRKRDESESHLFFLYLQETSRYCVNRYIITKTYSESLYIRNVQLALVVALL